MSAGDYIRRDSYGRAYWITPNGERVPADEIQRPDPRPKKRTPSKSLLADALAADCLFKIED